MYVHYKHVVPCITRSVFSFSAAGNHVNTKYATANITLSGTSHFTPIGEFMISPMWSKWAKCSKWFKCSKLAKCFKLVKWSSPTPPPAVPPPCIHVLHRRGHTETHTNTMTDDTDVYQYITTHLVAHDDQDVAMIVSS